MRQLAFSKTLMMIMFLVILAVPGGLVSPLNADESYVLVTMRDDTTVKLVSHTFSMHWVVPEVKDEITCKITQFEISELSEIYVMTIADNFCDKRDDWLFDVNFKDPERSPVHGFIEVTQEFVTGKSYETGEEKTISFYDIQKISFL